MLFSKNDCPSTEQLDGLVGDFLDVKISALANVDKSNLNEAYDCFEDFIGALETRMVAVPYIYIFHDKKLEKKYYNCRTPDDFDPISSGAADESIVYLNSEYYGLLIAVCTNYSKTSEIPEIDKVDAIPFKTFYERYVKDNEDIYGVVFNPYSEGIILSRQICEYAYLGLDNEKAKKAIKEIRESALKGK